MSSQGPSAGSRNTSTGSNNCFGPTGTTQVSPGYVFDKDSLRDASDWIQYKKRVMILKDSDRAKAKDPWFVRGNDYRLDYIGGLYQNGVAPGCAGCTGTTGSSAYNSKGPF
jgi:hypothetical protein